MPEKILVVDDMPVNVKLLADLLTVKGYTVVTAANGAEALAKVDKEQPGLVLLDVMMPGMSVVAQQAEYPDADIRSAPEHPQHLGGRLAAAHDDRVPLIVALSARESERLAEGRAREAHRHDGLCQEEHDDEPRVLVPAEGEGHDRDEHQGAEGRGLGDVDPLRDAGAEPVGSIEIECAEGDAPDEQDRHELTRLVPERWHVGDGHQVEPDHVGENQEDGIQAG